MSKIRNLPELTSPAENDILYAVDTSVGSNGGRKVTIATLKDATSLTDEEVKIAYENNPDTNAFTDAEKSKLAGIESGATADQDASEVPYDNTDSGILSTNVQDALDEIQEEANQLLVKPVTGLIVSYGPGVIRYNNTRYEIVAGNIALNTNITNGRIYADIDGIVKQTASGVTPPALSVPMALFSTNSSAITGLSDTRQTVVPSIIKSQNADISSILPDNVVSGGTSDSLASANHTHAVTTASAVTVDAGTSNGAGSANSLARSDHTHGVTVDSAVTVDASTSNGAGSGAALARANHTHALTLGNAVTIDTTTTNGSGSGAALARANHTHTLTTGTPVSTGSANSAGSSAGVAKSDHVHDTVIAYQTATDTVDATTTSTTDVVLTSMSITVAVAGVYSVRFSTSCLNSGNGAERNYFSIYSNGVQIASSERKVGISGGAYSTVSCEGVTGALTAGQVIDIRWRVIAGTGTAARRSMTIKRLGPS